ncbi:amidohydrolase [Haloechinothrix sp. LS1_15]|uniref:amidohydrolase n=1 Tax=Haloechinothrix sp. LS1_15 TaxID=2652248 RepID=UPI0029446B18|nr:amidohydrolase [Haloechinothrix sp. LS1_15]MDV6014007.1 amidohydrolase [Haloechinothrix sp. LS1_15]
MTSSRTTLLTGGRIHSPSAHDATAMAVTDGVVAWLGQDAPGRALHPDAEEMPLGGALVTPAFVDAHVHATATGLHLDGPDLAALRSADELLVELATLVRQVPPGQVLLGHGWDEDSWSSSRLPSRAELDAVCGEVPVYLSRVDVHSALISSAAAALAPDARASPGWSEDGPITGAAHHHIRAATREAITAEQRARAQRTFLDAAAAAGITCVHECAGPDISGEADLTALLALSAGADRPEVVAYWGEQAHAADDPAVERAHALGARGLAGDLFADGALGSRTAALHEPYADAAGTGMLHLSADDVARHVLACTEAGLQAGFHAIGDRAITAVVEGFRKAEAVAGRRAIAARCHRIEHLEMVTAEQAGELAGWNVTASMQPAFDALWGGQRSMYAARLGSERAAALNPLATLAARGVPLACGSDAPVTPLDPWRSVRAAVHHRTPESGISPRAAFNAHTRGGYRAAGVFDGLTGTLVPGAPAHYAVWEAGELAVTAPDSRVRRWSTDPRSRVPALPRLDPGTPLPRCLRTVRDGRTIFAA